MQTRTSTDTYGPDINRGLKDEYRLIFDSAKLGIALTLNGAITCCNPYCEVLFGYSPGELDGQSVRLLFDSDADYERAYATGCRAPDGRHGSGNDLSMRRKTGDSFWCEVSGKAIGSGAAGEAAEAAVWIFHDIDARKLAETALVEAHKDLEASFARRTSELETANRTLQAEMQLRRRVDEKQRIQQTELARMARVNTAGEMVSSLAHELGQPLASMLNYAHGCLLRLATGNATPEELKHGLIRAVRNAEQAGEIVRRVRRFLHKRPPEKRLHDINRILGDIVEFLTPEATRQEVTLRIRGSDYPQKISVDRVEIEQVIVNLAKNAFEALAETSDRPRIVELSSIATSDHTAVIAVADSGPGVPPYLHTSIFEPYFTTKTKGMGFGLAICCSLIEAHGGTIRAGDSWLGGALFEIILPTGEAQ